MCATVSWDAHESFMHHIFILKMGVTLRKHSIINTCICCVCAAAHPHGGGPSECICVCDLHEQGEEGEERGQEWAEIYVLEIE
jgi:hypothetical protein